MKRILFFCLSFFFSTTLICVAQENQDVVYLKNGTNVRGTIIEFVPDEYVDISMPNGRVRSLDMKDVERIVNKQTRPESRTSRPSQNNSRSQQNGYRPPQNNSRYMQNNNDRYIQNNDRNSQKKKKFYVTPKIGLNKSFQGPYGDENPKIGFDIGSAFEYAFTSRFTLESGLMYSNRIIGYSNDNEFIHYFYIPIFPKFFIHRGLNIFAGPQFGICSHMYNRVERRFEPSHSFCAGFGYLLGIGLSVSLSYSIADNFYPYYEKNWQTHIGWSF